MCEHNRSKFLCPPKDIGGHILKPTHDFNKVSERIGNHDVDIFRAPEEDPGPQAVKGSSIQEQLKKSGSTWA